LNAAPNATVGFYTVTGSEASEAPAAISTLSNPEELAPACIRAATCEHAHRGHLALAVWDADSGGNG